MSVSRVVQVGADLVALGTMALALELGQQPWRVASALEPLYNALVTGTLPSALAAMGTNAAMIGTWTWTWTCAGRRGDVRLLYVRTLPGSSTWRSLKPPSCRPTAFVLPWMDTGC